MIAYERAYKASLTGATNAECLALENWDSFDLVPGPVINIGNTFVRVLEVR
jgi:hypothetical protein